MGLMSPIKWIVLKSLGSKSFSCLEKWGLILPFKIEVRESQVSYKENSQH